MRLTASFQAKLSLNGRRVSMSFIIETGRPAVAALDPGKAGTRTKVRSNDRFVPFVDTRRQ